MTEPGMTLERFAGICAAYGHDPRRWPADERAAAEAAASTAEGRALMQQAAVLDTDLDRLASAPAHAQLRAAILASAPMELDRPPSFAAAWLAVLREEVFSWRPALPALALALILGIVAGLLDEDAEPTDIVQLAAFQQDFEDY